MEKAILAVRGLVKYYGRRKVVDGVSFEIGKGEVVGLLGSNGAGKTTSFRMTTGQVVPDDGQVMFNGSDVTDWPMYKRARLGMGYLSQESSVFRKLSVEQNILAILEALPICRSLGRKLTRQERWERTDAVLEQFGLEQIRKSSAARISGGEKRRLEIARCLVCEPNLILLDEPFAAVDPLTNSDIQKIILNLAREGISVLLTDHNVRDVLNAGATTVTASFGTLSPTVKRLEIHEYAGMATASPLMISARARPSQVGAACQAAYTVAGNLTNQGTVTVAAGYGGGGTPADVGHGADIPGDDRDPAGHESNAGRHAPGRTGRPGAAYAGPVAPASDCRVSSVKAGSGSKCRAAALLTPMRSSWAG
jgi:LPS export ABC transporter ATP-binding protein